LGFLLDLNNNCKDQKTLANVAAGPLEDLFVYNGVSVIEKLKIAADADENFQLALSGVWLDEDEDEIYRSWYDLMKRYGFVGKNPRQAL
jgi:hypothetical protein